MDVRIAAIALLLAGCGNAEPNNKLPVVGCMMEAKTAWEAPCLGNAPCDCTDLVPWTDSSWVRGWEDYKNEEVGKHSYQKVNLLLTCEPKMKSTVAEAITDGKITYLEYEQIGNVRLDLLRQQHERETRLIAEEIKRRVTE